MTPFPGFKKGVIIIKHFPITQLTVEWREALPGSGEQRRVGWGITWTDGRTELTNHTEQVAVLMVV